MPDAITSSPSPASPSTEKMASNKREIGDPGDSGQKDFAATFDSVREKKAPEAANGDQVAANPDPQVATVVLDPVATLPPPDVVADPSGVIEPPPAPPVDVAADPTAAAAAAAPAMAAATVVPATLAKLGGAQWRPETRVAAQWTAPAALDASAKRPGPAPTEDKGSGQPQMPAADKARIGAREFKLPEGVVADKTGNGGLELTDPGKPATSTTSTAAAEQAASATTARATDARSDVLKLDTRLPLHSPRFNETFSQQVVVLSQHGVQQAQMTLNPPELGPVEVRITVQNDQASVQIAAASGLARDVIQDALPKLREMLDQSGVRLSDAGVFAQLPQREQPSPQSQAQRQDWTFNGPGPRRSPMEDASCVPQGARRVGLIDAYA